jgi:uncharacterized protein
MKNSSTIRFYFFLATMLCGMACFGIEAREKSSEAANSYHNAIDIDDDEYKKSISLATEAADVGDPSGLCILGDFYYTGFAVKKNFVKSFKLREAAAKKNHLQAKLLIGGMYAKGIGVAKDKNKSLFWFKEAIKASKNPYDANIRGYRLAEDFSHALDYLKAQTMKKNRRAECVLGIMYHQGWGTYRSYRMAKKHYLNAAKANDYIAQYLYGKMLTNAGKKKEGIPFLKKSALQGYYKAQYFMGIIAEKRVQKIKWYELAARQGYTVAMTCLGEELLAENKIKEAKSWYEKAAKLGNSSACNRLGIYYMKGFHEPKDMKKAIYWFEKSAKLGNDLGNNQLKKLTSKLRSKKSSRTIKP